MTGITVPGESGRPNGGRERRRLVQALMEISATLDLGSTVMDCVFIDLSVGEAFLKVDQPLLQLRHGALQEGREATLTVFNRLDVHTQAVLAAEIVWQRGSLVGVRFADDADRVRTAFRKLLPEDCIPLLAAEVLPHG